MRSRWYHLTVGAVLVLGVLLGLDTVNASAQVTDPRAGTWKLNVAKSKYEPGPAPKSLMVKVEAAGQGEKVTSDFDNADGTHTTTQYTANFDGKEYSLTGSALGADKISLKRVDARTTIRTDKKGEKVVQTLTRVVSQDGKDHDGDDERHKRSGPTDKQCRRVREAIEARLTVSSFGLWYIGQLLS